MEKVKGSMRSKLIDEFKTVLNIEIKLLEVSFD